MLYGRIFLLTFLSLIIFASISCKTENPTPPDQVQELQVDTLYSFLNFEDHGISMASSIAFVDNERIAVSDYQSKKVIIVDSDGNLITKFGKEGRGPAEFLAPADIQLTNSNLNVIDASQYKVLEYDFDGNFVDSYVYGSGAFGGSVALKDNRTYYTGAGGEDNFLIKRVIADSDSIFLFGEAKGSTVEDFDLDKSKQEALSGKIPAYFKNLVSVGAGDEYLYVFLDSYSELRKYDFHGNLIWDKKIELDHNQQLFDQNIEHVKTVKGNNLPILRYIIDMKVINDEAYFLTSKLTDVPQQLVKVNEDGYISYIYNLPNQDSYYGSFNIHPQNNTLYITQAMGGDVLMGVLE